MKAALRTQLRTEAGFAKALRTSESLNDHRDVDGSDTRTCETAYCNGPANVSYSQIRPWCSIGMDGSLPPDSFPVRRMLVTAVMGQFRTLALQKEIGATLRLPP